MAEKTEVDGIVAGLVGIAETLTESAGALRATLPALAESLDASRKELLRVTREGSALVAAAKAKREKTLKALREAQSSLNATYIRAKAQLG